MKKISNRKITKWTLVLFALISFLSCLVYREDGFGRDGFNNSDSDHDQVLSTERSGRSVIDIGKDKLPDFRQLRNKIGASKAFELWAAKAGINHPDYFKFAQIVVDSFENELAAKEFIVSLQNASTRQHFTLALARAYIREMKSQEALNFLEHVPAGDTRREFLRVISRNGDLGPIYEKLQSGEFTAEDLKITFDNLALRSDLSGPESSPDGDRIMRFITSGTLPLAQALPIFEALSTKLPTNRHLENFASKLLEENPEKYSKLYRQFLSTASQYHPGFAIDSFNKNQHNLSKTDSDESFSNIVKQFGRNDLSDCIQWINQLEANERGMAVDALKSGLSPNTSVEELVAATAGSGLTREEVLEISSSLEERATFLKPYLEEDLKRRNEDEELKQLVESNASDLGFKGLLGSINSSGAAGAEQDQKVISGWFHHALIKDFDRAIEVADKNNQLYLNEFNRNYIARSLLNENPEKAMAWAVKTSNEIDTPKLVEEMQTNWMHKDSQGFANWLQTEAPTDRRDSATYHMIEWLASKSATNEAKDWVPFINSQEIKTKASKLIDSGTSE